MWGGRTVGETDGRCGGRMRPYRQTPLAWMLAPMPTQYRFNRSLSSDITVGDTTSSDPCAWSVVVNHVGKRGSRGTWALVARPVVGFVVLAVVVSSSIGIADAQGPVRRLGERIRQRTSETPPPGALSGQRAPGAIGGPRVPGTSGLRAPISRSQPAAAPSGPSGQSQADQDLQRRGTVAPTGFAERSANFNRATASGAATAAARAGAASADWQTRGDAASSSALREVPPAPAPRSPLAKQQAADSFDRQVPAEVYQPDNRARLGVIVDTPPVTEVPGLPPRRPRGALVTEVHPNSAAEASGLRPGDLIVGLDGQLVASVLDLTDRLGGYEPGDAMRIQFTRDERLINSHVTLAGPDGFASNAAVSNDRSAAPPSGLAGASGGGIMSGLGSALGGLFGGNAAANRSQPDGQPSPQLPELIVPDGASKDEETSDVLPEPIPAPLPEPRAD